MFNLNGRIMLRALYSVAFLACLGHTSTIVHAGEKLAWDA